MEGRHWCLCEVRDRGGGGADRDYVNLLVSAVTIMAARALSLLLVVAAWSAVAHGLGFNLGGGAIKCISDEISRATTIVGEITSDSPEQELSGLPGLQWLSLMVACPAPDVFLGSHRV